LPTRFLCRALFGFFDGAAFIFFGASRIGAFFFLCRFLGVGGFAFGVFLRFRLALFFRFNCFRRIFRGRQIFFRSGGILFCLSRNTARTAKLKLKKRGMKFSENTLGAKTTSGLPLFYLIKESGFSEADGEKQNLILLNLDETPKTLASDV
jgi:hypothetical protein